MVKERKPVHIHSTTDFIREYQKPNGTVEGVDSRGRKTRRTVYRRTMVWGCSCGRGPTTETS